MLNKTGKNKLQRTHRPNWPSEVSLTVQRDDEDLVGKWLGSHAGAENWTTELDVYCSDYSVKLWTHFEGLKTKLIAERQEKEDRKGTKEDKKKSAPKKRWKVKGERWRDKRGKWKDHSITTNPPVLISTVARIRGLWVWTSAPSQLTLAPWFVQNTWEIHSAITKLLTAVKIHRHIHVWTSKFTNFLGA